MIPAVRLTLLRRRRDGVRHRCNQDLSELRDNLFGASRAGLGKVIAFAGLLG